MTKLVFDVGGTALRCARWNNGRLDARAAAESPGVAQRDADDDETRVRAVTERLTALGREVAGGTEVSELGLAFPGPVGSDGSVRQAPTLWGRELARPVQLADRLGAAFDGARVVLVNDVTAAGYRYADELRDFCIVTVSSGIGNKLFFAGDVEVGPQHRGGEIGHWRIDDRADAPPCECGGRGHLGAIASGRSTPWHLQQLRAGAPELAAGSRLPAAATNHDLVAAFRAGDELARAVVERAAAALGQALALLHVGVGVERFVVYGGFAQALGDGYLDALRTAAAAHAWGEPSDWHARIRAGAADDDSGLIGMGVLLDRGSDRR
ncbi:MAG: ROK family protein [Planctomycetes bacterium]|nr:ROK family protein [Planctomycetota bacterium]